MISSATYVYPTSTDVYGNDPLDSKAPRFPWVPLPDGIVYFEARCAICRKGLCLVTQGGKWEGHKYPTVFVGMCEDCVRKVRNEPSWNPNDHLNFPDHIKYD